MPQIIAGFVAFMLLSLAAAVVLMTLDVVFGTWPLYPPAFSWAIHGFVIGFLLRLAAAYPEPLPDPDVRAMAFVLLAAWAVITALGSAVYLSQ
jgi:hypothetical protein